MFVSLAALYFDCTGQSQKLAKTTSHGPKRQNTNKEKRILDLSAKPRLPVKSDKRPRSPMNQNGSSSEASNKSVSSVRRMVRMREAAQYARTNCWCYMCTLLNGTTPKAHSTDDTTSSNSDSEECEQFPVMRVVGLLHVKCYSHTLSIRYVLCVFASQALAAKDLPMTAAIAMESLMKQSERTVALENHKMRTEYRANE